MPRSGTRKRKASPIPAQPDRKRSKRGAVKSSGTSPSTQASTPRTSVTLDGLPDELLLMILEQLRKSVHDGTHSKPYYQLSLTNRHLHELANDFLYASFNCHFAHPSKFLRTLVARPQLGTRVKDILWCFHSMIGHEESMHPAPPTSSDRRLFRQTLKDLNVSNRAELLKDFEGGLSGSILKLAMLFTPNLRNLWVSDRTPTCPHIGRSTNRRSYLQSLKNATNNRPMVPSPAFTHLRSLHICMVDLRFEEIEPLFRLPSLEKLAIDGAYATTVPNTAVSRTSTVTELEICDSFVSSEALVRLISSCSELKTLHFVYASNLYRGTVAKIHYPSIYSALEAHKSSLTNIYLGDISDRTFILLTDYDRGLLGSFQDFEKLQHFSVPFEAFDDASDGPHDAWMSDDEDDWQSHPSPHLTELLPAGLKKLGFTVFESEEYGHSCLRSLLKLHSEFRERIPDLIRIHIVAHKSAYMRFMHLNYARQRFALSPIDLFIEQEGQLFDTDRDFASDYDSLADDVSDFDEDDMYDHLDDFADELGWMDGYDAYESWGSEDDHWVLDPPLPPGPFAQFQLSQMMMAAMEDENEDEDEEFW